MCRNVGHEPLKNFTAAVEQGLADAEAGRVHSHETVVAEMKARFQKREPK